MADSAKRLIINGTNASGSALVVGEVVRASGDDQIARAQSPSSLQGILGVTLSPIGSGGPAQIVVGGAARVLLAVGLTPTAGDTLYVSTVTGRATNVPPTVAVAIGTVTDAGRYATDSTVEATLWPQGLGTDAVADWDPNVFRFFQLSKSRGDDANPGYVDGAPVSADAAVRATAVRTWARVLAIIPRVGAGRKFVLLVESDDYTSETIMLQGLVGYAQGPLIRGTCTDTTASSVAFANDAADKVMAGFVRYTGTESAGYRVSNVVSTSVVDVVRASDGGAAGLPVGSTIRGVRVRFDSATLTVSLRNFCTNVMTNAAGQLTFGNNATGVSVGDVLYLEMPGVRTGAQLIDGIWNGSTDQPGVTVIPPFMPTRLVGLFPQGLLTDFVGNYRNCDSLLLCGHFQTGKLTLGAFGTFYQITNIYADETGVTRTVGANRIEGTSGAIITGSLCFSVSATNTWVIGGNFSLGSSSTFRTFISSGCGVYGGLAFLGASQSFIGNFGNSSARPFYVDTPAAGAALTLSQLTQAQVRGMFFTNFSNGTGGIRCTGETGSARIDEVTGAIGLGANDFGIDLGSGIGSAGPAVGWNIILGRITAVTFTTAVNQEIAMGAAAGSDTVRYAFTDAQTRGMVIRDDLNNCIVGTPNVLHIDSETGQKVSVANATSLEQFRIARIIAGSPQVTAAQGNLAANVTNVAGVLASLRVIHARLITSGPAIVAFSGSITVPEVAYVSEASAGFARSGTPPPGNFALAVGQILADLGGGLGLVFLDFDKVPVAT